MSVLPLRGNYISTKDRRCHVCKFPVRSPSLFRNSPCFFLMFSFKNRKKIVYTVSHMRREICIIMALRKVIRRVDHFYSNIYLPCKAHPQGHGYGWRACVALGVMKVHCQALAFSHLCEPTSRLPPGSVLTVLLPLVYSTWGWEVVAGVLFLWTFHYCTQDSHIVPSTGLAPFVIQL